MDEVEGIDAGLGDAFKRSCVASSFPLSPGWGTILNHVDQETPSQWQSVKMEGTWLCGHHMSITGLDDFGELSYFTDVEFYKREK